MSTGERRGARAAGAGVAGGDVGGGGDVAGASVAGADVAAGGPVCRVLLVPGSLRRRSVNTAALRAAARVAPAGVEAVLYERLGRLPHFDPDDDVEPLPPEVALLRDAIHAADAVVFSTPEYAGALPGSFKNLLDWTIGDDRPGSIYEKPVAWVNTSPRGAQGAYDELRTVLGYAHAAIIADACGSVPVPSAMLGPDGAIFDEATVQRLADVMLAVVHAVRRDPGARR